MTCRFETDGLIYTDYMEGLKTHVDVLQYTNKTCKEVEYINVRGYECSKCTAFLKQNGNKLAFHYKPKPSRKHCTFKPNEYTNCAEDNRTESSFGYYKLCVNPAHRCSMNSSSTTQTWLGSNVH